MAPKDDQVHTPAEYLRRFDEACKVAAGGDCFWNERFLSALARRGLTLATERLPHEEDAWYPKGFPYVAPRPYGEQDAWQTHALVVWAAGPAVGQVAEGPRGPVGSPGPRGPAADGSPGETEEEHRRQSIESLLHNEAWARGEIERLQAVADAASAYFQGYMQDEADDDMGWVCDREQRLKAAALRDALDGLKSGPNVAIKPRRQASA